MDQQINNFVRNAYVFGVARSDLSVLRYAIKDENVLAKIDQIKNFLDEGNRNLISVLGFELNNQSNIGSVSSILENIKKAAPVIESLSEEFLPNKKDLFELLALCSQSFDEDNFKAVIEALKSDREKFRKQIILLQDLCAEDFFH